MEAGRAIAGGFVTPDRTLADRLDQPLLPGDREDGDGRRPLRLRAPREGDRAACAGRAAVRHGEAGEAERRDRQFGDARRDRRDAAACRFRWKPSRRRSATRKAFDSNLRGFRAGLEAARTGAVAQPECRASAAALARVAHRHRARDRRDDPGGCARHRHRGRAPARRLPGPRLRAALSRSPRGRSRGRRARRCRRAVAARDRASPGGAHVVRGRDPRRAGQDRSGALRPHRRRAEDQAQRAVCGDRVPETRHRGDVLDPAHRAWRARS